MESLMRTLRIACGILALVVGTAVYAQSAPDLDGTWELNTEKGENLGMVAALKETLVVTQTAEQITVDFTDVFQGNTTTRQVSYDLSGEPVINYAAMGERSETVSKWIDNVLVTTWTSEGAIAGTEVVRTETRSLSEDGNIMTVTTARGERPAMVLVYERQ
jgi:hypothetical protein